MSEAPPWAVGRRARLLRIASWVAMVGAIGAGSAGAEGALPLCRVRVELDPPLATVGQQVLYRLTIERRRDVATLRWGRNLTFPSFRSEWLPGVVAAKSEDSGGEGYQPYEERRALFPVRAGQLTIPAAGLLCRSGEIEEAVEIPAIVLPVVDPPEEGRPQAFGGLVGPVEVSATVTPRTLVLGESVRISIVVQGPANLWEATPPLNETFGGEDLEVFSLPREIARDAGRRLKLRRYFTYDLVPRRTGPFELPEISVSWFDPATGRFSRTSAGRPRFTVTATPAPGPEGTELSVGAADSQSPGQSVAHRARPDATGDGGAWQAPAAAVGAVAGLALLTWLTVRRGASRRAAPPNVETALDEAHAAEKSGELERAAACLDRALRWELAERIPQVRALSAEELFDRARGDRERALVLLLQRLDRARFGPQPDLPELRGVRVAFTSWRDEARRGSPSA